MRLGSRTSNEFLQNLNQKNQDIQQIFLKKMTENTEMRESQVMLGDSTITHQKTFDPLIITNFFSRINNRLKEWSTQDVSISNNEDIRRVFTKFEIMEGNYLVSGHLSLQFHALLYYKPDKRVVKCQKELAKIIDLTKNKEQQMADNSDQFVLNKLKDMGYHDFDQQKLFEIFYENDELREKIHEEINENEGDEFQRTSQKKKELFDELDNLLIETYQTSPVLIDDTRLVAGEEGYLCTLDLEFVRNKTKEGLFDPRKISEITKKKLIQKLDEVYNAIDE